MLIAFSAFDAVWLTAFFVYTVRYSTFAPFTPESTRSSGVVRREESLARSLGTSENSPFVALRLSSETVASEPGRASYSASRTRLVSGIVNCTVPCPTGKLTFGIFPAVTRHERNAAPAAFTAGAVSITCSPACASL